jgi:hypothetical protein
MVNPVRNQTLRFSKPPSKKKPTKEIDLRVKKVLKKSKPSIPEKSGSSIKSSQKIVAEKAYLAAEKASYAARQMVFETQKAALKAQKAAFLAQRAHMAQQAAAAKRARAAEKAKKVAQKAAKKAAALRRVVKIKACLARPEEKKRSRFLKKYIPSSSKKKKSPMY